SPALTAAMTNTDPNAPISTSVRRPTTTTAADRRGTSKILLMPMLSVWSCPGRTRSFQPLACPFRAPCDRSPTAVISSAPRLERPRVRCGASAPPPLGPRYVSPAGGEMVYLSGLLRRGGGGVGG